jgi:putative N-acetylmannosamine-6-phosphate epimerase
MIKAQAQNTMTKEQAFEILMQQVNEGRKDIAEGRYYTPDQVDRLLKQHIALKTKR